MFATESKERYLAQFRKARPHPSAGGPGWLDKLRGAGMTSFQALGFPTTRHEEWKYTNVEPIVSQSFLQPSAANGAIDKEALLSRSLVKAEGLGLVFINGIYQGELSRPQRPSAGVRVQSLAEAIAQDDAVVAERLGRYAPRETQAFVALNTAFIDDGAVVTVPPGCRLEEPIYLIFASAAGPTPLISHPRVLIIAGAGSEARIVETYVGLEGGRYFCNPVTELIGEDHSIVEHCRLQQEAESGFHVGAVVARAGRGCRLTAHALTLSGSLTRNNVHAVLDGEDAECVLNGLYLADGAEHIDNYTEIEHARPRGFSSELYKGILGGSGQGVFHGRIVVCKDAQKTNARQTNRNLLLSARAAVHTKPQLEIYADDVKCSHGSTIGQMDADALFYLQSRGLDSIEARSLLSFAFAGEVIGKISMAGLRRRLEEYVAERFRRR